MLNKGKQHSGFNAPLCFEHAEISLNELDQYALMNRIDEIDTDRDTSQYGKVTRETFVMPRPTYDFYMKLMAQSWYYHGLETVAPEDVVNTIRMFCVTLIARV